MQSDTETTLRVSCGFLRASQFDEIKKSWGKSNLPQVDLAQVIDEVLHSEVLETVINCFYQLLTKV